MSEKHKANTDLPYFVTLNITKQGLFLSKTNDSIAAPVKKINWLIFLVNKTDAVLSFVEPIRQSTQSSAKRKESFVEQRIYMVGNDGTEFF